MPTIMNKLLKIDFLITIITVFYIIAMALWISRIFTSHMSLAAVVSLVLSIIIGWLIYYGTKDLTMAISIALSTLPVSFVFALFTDRVLESFWRTSIFHTESDMLDLMDITIGAIAGAVVLTAVCYTINKNWEKR